LRDIRNDLRERLARLDGAQGDVIATYEEERQRIDDARRKAIEKIESERAAIKKLLEIEEARASALPSFTSRSEPTVPLADFLLVKVRTSGRISKDELRAAAEEAGYMDKRAFHTTLMNITNGRRLHQNADGSYVLPPMGSGALFESSLTKEEDMRFN
jgi:hypothetical protein